MIVIKSEFGTTYISARRNCNKIHFQMDDCEAELSVKEAKAIIAELKKAILGNKPEPEEPEEPEEYAGDYADMPVLQSAT